MSAGVNALLRKDALSIFQQGIDAADPYQAVKNCLTLSDNTIEIALDLNDPTQKRMGQWSKVYIIAFGKAACRMAQAAVDIIPAQLITEKPIVITNIENVQLLKNIDVLGTGHPIPDTAGIDAAQRVTDQLKRTKTGELVLTLISGGGSALLPYPVTEISLNDKQQTTDLLLASGAAIEQINYVRKHLSQLKGGQLAELALPADLHSFILSDVIGDDLSSIASGPTVADNTTFEDAINILTKNEIWDKIPPSVKAYLQKGAQGLAKETPKANADCFKNTSHTLVASNSISLNQSINTAKKLAYTTTIFSSALCGEAKEIAEQLVLAAKQIENSQKDATALLAGGESTVTIKGTGLGGRNQEMALAFAIAAEKHKLKSHWAFLSGGTDGRDGPTDAAGGLVDSNTLNRIKQGKISPDNLLDNNDSYSALKESQDLVITGATGTNVADLQILLIRPE
mgnify:CR=1 FL=1